MRACRKLYLSNINVYNVDQNPNSRTGFEFFCIYNVPNARAFCQTGAILCISSRLVYLPDGKTVVFNFSTFDMSSFLHIAYLGLYNDIDQEMVYFHDPYSRDILVSVRDHVN